MIQRHEGCVCSFIPVRFSCFFSCWSDGNHLGDEMIVIWSSCIYFSLSLGEEKGDEEWVDDNDLFDGFPLIWRSSEKNEEEEEEEERSQADVWFGHTNCSLLFDVCFSVSCFLKKQSCCRVRLVSSLCTTLSYLTVCFEREQKENPNWRTSRCCWTRREERIMERMRPSKSCFWLWSFSPFDTFFFFLLLLLPQVSWTCLMPYFLAFDFEEDCAAHSLSPCLRLLCYSIAILGKSWCFCSSSLSSPPPHPTSSFSIPSLKRPDKASWQVSSSSSSNPLLCPLLLIPSWELIYPSSSSYFLLERNPFFSLSFFSWSFRSFCSQVSFSLQGREEGRYRTRWDCELERRKRRSGSHRI